MVTRFTATRTIPAPASSVWPLVADPARHHLFDATGMVGDLASAPPGDVGDVFTMEMTYRSGEHVEHYRSDNHVTAFDPQHRIAWATALPGSEPLGWTWRYDLAGAPDGTRVQLTHDWADTPDENVRRFGVPLTNEAGLATSLELLERAALSDPTAGPGPSLPPWRGGQRCMG